MQKRSGKKTLIIVCVLAAIVLLLLVAGTILRMHTHDLGFGEALVSFLSDTFCSYADTH